MLLDYTNEVMENISIRFTKINKEEVLKGGREFVFKYWDNFNCEKFQNPGPYFKEIFKRGIANYQFHMK
jgi:hypothetical protein